MKKIVIADDQIISPLGFSSEENIRAIKNKRSGIKKHSDKTLSKNDFYAARIDEGLLAKAFEEIGNPQAFTKLEQMFLLCAHKILDFFPNLNMEKTGLIVSTTKGNIDGLNPDFSIPNEKAKLYELGKTVQDFFGLPNRPITLSNACISGGLAIAIGKRMLESEKFENILVLGGDLVSEFTFSGFTSFQAISGEPCKPFSKNRTGITLGEAAAAVLLSSNEALQKPDSIFVVGSGSANDANHISGPSRTGEGLFLSIQKALEEAKTTAEKIDFISPHGTGTTFNDEMEAIAFSRASLLESPLHSLKGFYGHTLGASALVETIIAARSLQNDELYPSLGFDELGVSKPVKIQKELENKKLKTALKTASGFGGCNVALVLQKGFEPETFSFPKEDNPKEGKWKIQDFVHLKNSALFYREVFRGKPSNDLKTFAKQLYSELQMNYPKFHKMDDLCKLGILASEVLYRNNAISSNTALVLTNNASSLETDEKHQASIADKENYFPSPAVFVYTLPNIVLGEISIKHDLKSEQAFFVSEKLDAELLVDYSETLLKTGKAENVICGWIDLHKSVYSVFLCLISQTGDISFTKKNLEKIYNQNYE